MRNREFLKNLRSPWRPALALLAAAVCIAAPRQTLADCLTENTKKYSAAVFDAVDDVTAGLIVQCAQSGNPALCIPALGLSVAAVGTLVGQLVNFGIASWWDPVVEVFPDDPDSVVFTISDGDALSIADDVLTDAAGSGSWTLADLSILNSLSPGMAAAAEDLLLTSIRAFAHTSQGAAAFAVHGRGHPTVVNAAQLLSADLQAYVDAMSAYAILMDAHLPDVISPYTVTQYQDYFANPGIAPAEISIGERIFSLAEVTMTSDLEARLISFMAVGDTSNEAAAFPADGYQMGELMLAGLNTFDIDCETCFIATVPESERAGLALLGLAILAFCGRRDWRVNSSLRR